VAVGERGNCGEEEIIMDQNEEFIRNLKIEDVPWSRIVTAYGMATELPGYLKTLEERSKLSHVKEAFGEITNNIEHQGTLWYSTAFGLIFLVRIYHDVEAQKESNKIAAWLTEELEDFFALIIDCYHEILDCYNDVESVKNESLPLFSDMLKEEYLWPEGMSEEEEEARWEEGFPDDLAASFYYYSYQVVKEFDK